MATFAVNASDDTVKALSELMDGMAQEGEKKADTLQRIFRIASQNADGEVLKHSGVDVSALDAAQENIRSMFVTAVTGREQIVENCNMKIAEIRDKKDALETDLRAKITAAEESKVQAEQAANNAAKAAAQAISDAKAARDTAEANAALAAEKDKTILALTDKLTAAEAKADGYDALIKAKADADAQIAALQAQLSTEQKEHERILNDEKKSADRALSDAQKDAETKIRELQAKMDRAISDAKKDAALAQEKAIVEAAKEIREHMQEEIRQADKENAKLQAKLDIQLDQIKELQNRISAFESQK